MTGAVEAAEVDALELRAEVGPGVARAGLDHSAEQQHDEAERDVSVDAVLLPVVDGPQLKHMLSADDGTAGRPPCRRPEASPCQKDRLTDPQPAPS